MSIRAQQSISTFETRLTGHMPSSVGRYMGPLTLTSGKELQDLINTRIKNEDWASIGAAIAGLQRADNEMGAHITSVLKRCNTALLFNTKMEICAEFGPATATMVSIVLAMWKIQKIVSMAQAGNVLELFMALSEVATVEEREVARKTNEIPRNYIIQAANTKPLDVSPEKMRELNIDGADFETLLTKLIPEARIQCFLQQADERGAHMETNRVGLLRAARKSHSLEGKLLEQLTNHGKINPSNVAHPLSIEILRMHFRDMYRDGELKAGDIAQDIMAAERSFAINSQVDELFKTSYDYAVESGFNGDEDDFIASVNGYKMGGIWKTRHDIATAEFDGERLTARVDDLRPVQRNALPAGYGSIFSGLQGPTGRAGVSLPTTDNLISIETPENWTPPPFQGTQTITEQRKALTIKLHTLLASLEPIDMEVVLKLQQQLMELKAKEAGPTNGNGQSIADFDSRILGGLGRL
jgi:hypothetical protein